MLTGAIGLFVLCRSARCPGRVAACAPLGESESDRQLQSDLAILHDLTGALWDELASLFVPTGGHEIEIWGHLHCG